MIIPRKLRQTRFSTSTTGALMLTGGQANRSFVVLRMIEAFHGAWHLSMGILIDQLGSDWLLSIFSIVVACIFSAAAASGQDVAWGSTYPRPEPKGTSLATRNV